MLNVFQVATSSERHVIASGSSDSPYDICIWEKPVSLVVVIAEAHANEDQTKQAANRKKDDHMQQEAINKLNGAVLLLIILWMAQAWGGQLMKVRFGAYDSA